MTATLLPLIKQHQISDLGDHHASYRPPRAAARPDEATISITEDQVSIRGKLKGSVLPDRASLVGRPDHLWNPTGRHGDPGTTVGVDNEDGEEEHVAGGGAEEPCGK